MLLLGARTEYLPLRVVEEIPSLALWKEGHEGVYDTLHRRRTLIHAGAKTLLRLVSNRQQGQMVERRDRTPRRVTARADYGPNCMTMDDIRRALLLCWL